MPYCSSCGADVDASNAFCQSCGDSLEADATDGRGTASGADPNGQTHRTTAPPGRQATGDGPLRLGFVAGVGAFAVGYLFTYVRKSGEALDAVGSLSSQLSSAPEPWQAVGWVFMAMHHVTIEITGSSGSRTMSETLTAGALEEQWMLAVPVLALVAAGYWVATRTAQRPNVSGARAGATVVAGYLVCAVAVAFLSKWALTTTMFGESVSMSIAPKFIESVIVAGVGYPIVLGAIGGVLGES
ncbi:zinc ribbon domain-containing protein [Halobacterium wangiae]|uniref:zinc ribbon domain-containing protein n=1 Tax=Halobacterium wangiae TaxID=2902623 RepID=UPI001E292285|nr:zinc ribbon domain-containing protein [Halobacterium wangiae]